MQWSRKVSEEEGMCDALKMAALTHTANTSHSVTVAEGKGNGVTGHTRTVSKLCLIASAVDTPNDDGKGTRAKGGTSKSL